LKSIWRRKNIRFHKTTAVINEKKEPIMDKQNKFQIALVPKNELILNITVAVLGLIVLILIFVIWVIGMKARLDLSKTGQCSTCTAARLQHQKNSKLQNGNFVPPTGIGFPL
jgi:hypothetical protein